MSLTVRTRTARAVPEAADAVGQVSYHFLDVGGQKYGECTLVEAGSTRILIDGGHETDFDGQSGYSSIPKQLEKIFGSPPPYDLTLVVVTHCHADHVGCLLELIDQQVIRPKYALLTDPKLGFGRTADHDAAAMDLSDPVNILAAVLREEDASDLNDEDLADFVDAVGRVEQRYARLIERLSALGVKTIPYQGKPLPPELRALTAPTGLKLIGPSANQLLFCAQQIETTNNEANDALAERPGDADDILGLYRDLVGFGPESDARNPRGSGMNCQSITFAFGKAGERVLLAGDMQFVEPEVHGASTEMAKLRQAVIAAGPYKVFKTTHHTSHNGQDAAFLDAIGKPPIIVHSGGLRDASHPYKGVLQILKGRAGITFARTDRNGAITVQPHKPLSQAVTISRGALNDFTPNTIHDEPPPEPRVEAPVREVQVAGRPLAAGQGVRIVIIELPNAPIDITVAGVDISIRGGGPDDRRTTSREPPQLRRGGDAGLRLGRSLSGLLFVTDPNRLRANIGRAEADAALAGVEKAGGALMTATGDRLIDASARALQSNPAIKGLVILGGYDVAPSVRTDALGPDLRRLVGPRVGSDGDQFWVWSDGLYADTDGDHLAEVPVSRIPDARDSQLFEAALRAMPLPLRGRFGIRNVVRPFAEAVWTGAFGDQPFKVSEAFVDSDVVSEELSAPCHYFMLHGADFDGRVFSGEKLSGGYPRAFTAAQVPSSFSGVVFSGCCWGALIVDQKAVSANAGTPPPRTREASIALSYLRAGAQAFIGCTGSHYSGPDTDPDANFASRLHSAFFKRLEEGASPAKALHDAKTSYLEWVMANQSRMDPLSAARRFKNVAQFTCLGMGW